MTNEIFKDEILNEEQLDLVAGGTCQETDEIIDAVREVPCIGIYSGGKTKLTRAMVEIYLRKKYNIEAETHNGFLFFSDGDPNTYKREGKSLTHKQVIGIIKRGERWIY